MARLKVVTQTGKASGTAQVPDEVFARPSNPALLHEVVTRQQASWRQGTHAAKTRGLVSGGGRKPWRQKGTGRARAGSTRSPLWKGGGTVFGPVPRDHGWRMPKGKVRAALHVSLSEAVRAGTLVCVKEIKLKGPKTREFVDVLKALKTEGTVLVVMDEVSETVALAARNVPKAMVIDLADLTPYDVLAADWVVVAQPALAALSGGTGSVEAGGGGEEAPEEADDAA